MAKFRKKPVIIDAFQITNENFNETINCCINGREIYFSKENDCVYITTLEGEMRAKLGDWVIIGVKGEAYPCDKYIFDATYEKVED